MLLKIIKTLAYIFVLSALSFTAVYLLNKNNLDMAQKEARTINPETYNSEVKNSLQFGSVLTINGTPNLLKQVSQESKEQTDDSAVQYYYVALKEYGEDFIIKIKPGKLNAQSQTFTGKLIHLGDTEFGTRIKNALNNTIDLSDEENLDAGNQLDIDSRNLIAENSKGNFTNETFLVVDEDVLNERQVVLGIALWTSVLSLFLITLLRKKVFQVR